MITNKINEQLKNIEGQYRYAILNAIFFSPIYLGGYELKRDTVALVADNYNHFPYKKVEEFIKHIENTSHWGDVQYQIELPVINPVYINI